MKSGSTSYIKGGGLKFLARYIYIGNAEEEGEIESVSGMWITPIN